MLNNARSQLRRRGVADRMPWRRVEHLSSAEEDALVGHRRAELVRLLRTLPRRVSKEQALALTTCVSVRSKKLAALRARLEDDHAD